jgi:hypothetical protein
MNRTVTIFFGVLIIIGFCLAFTSYQIINITQQSNKAGDKEPTNSPTTNQTSGGPATNDTYKPPEKKDVELDVSIAETRITLHGKKSELYGNWSRGSDDLPYFNYYGGAVIVHNGGKKTANNVTIVVVEIRKQVLLNETRSIRSGYTYYRRIDPFMIRYDDTPIVWASVHCSESVPEEVTSSVLLNPPWERYKPPLNRPEITSFYITPKNPEIMNIVSQIRSNSTDWNDIAEWIHRSITYRSYSIMERGWRLGHETLSAESGNNVNLSILLCSMLRAAGWSQDDVYVGWRVDGEVEHTWVFMKDCDSSSWLSLEPISDGFNKIVFTDLEEAVHQSSASILFNDQKFIKEG